jgi:dephospho-CoA kinase
VLRVGLTGGLSCGKSTVAAMMEKRGAQVLRADLLAHELMRPGEPVYDQVVRHFGRGIVNKDDGSIDRAKLAELAFAGGRIKELNAIVHPAVIARQEQWIQETGAAHPKAIAVIEAALILEAGIGGRFDKLVVVTCSREQKIERFVNRNLKAGASQQDAAAARAEAERRIAAQMPEEEKVKAADCIIDNSGSLATTERQVTRMMGELRGLAAMS